MKKNDKTREQLLKELEKSNKRIAELEKTETERKQVEEQIKHLNLILRTIRNVNQLIVKEKSRGVLIQKACKILIEDRGYNSAWIVLLGDQREYINSAESGLGKSFIPIRKMLEEGTLPNCGNAALKKKDLVITEDPKNECKDCPLSINYSGHSGYSICLRYKDDIYGLLSVSALRHYIDDKEEQSLFGEVAGDIAFALHNIEMEEERKQAEEELAKYRQHLEELVKERTAELEEKNIELKRYNKLFEGRELRIKELRDKVKELEKKLSS